MSSPTWLTSPQCSISIDQSAHSISTPIQWLRFIFLSPCPQRIFFSAIDVLFLLILIGFSAHKLFSKFVPKNNSNGSIIKPLLETKTPRLKISSRFYLSLVLTAVLALISTVLCVLAFVRGTKSTWQLIEALFWLTQAITHVVILALIAHEKKFEAATHPISLRIYWVLNSIVVALLIASGIARFTTLGGIFDHVLKTDDVCFFIFFPISVSLFIIAVRGSSGIILQEPKIGSNSVTELSDDPNASAYAKASWISKVTWYWLNPLLSKGYKATLKLDEVPLLAPYHSAEAMEILFENNWRDQENNSESRLRTTLLKCFWKQIVFTGFLAVAKSIAIYIGPVLINSFVSYTSGDKNNISEGYYLVLVLLISKLVEALSSHHFTFHSAKLGMLIRCTIITALYKKGLRLSCSSRQNHGVGKIVNHMSVDAQQLADLMAQLHSIWLMPFQISVALALLYFYMGLSMIAALVAVIVVLIYSFMSTKSFNTYQYFVMLSRDSRLKAMNEMLNNMRVIKFQAWEEHFNQRVRSSREKEYTWLSKFTYALARTTFILWSMPAVLSVLVFAIAVLIGTPLDTGTVFTATTILRIIQDPIRTFPQALIQVSQALISLSRVDGFLTSKELDDSSVERENGYNNEIVVEVRDGNFSWDDDGDDVTLKHVNLLIKKGELAAIVGTVGSGKSSLLASILGELHKKSGKVKVSGTTAYVAQTSWIQNATIRENILFGSPMNLERYSEVIRVCSLEKDLEVMDHGDQTEIGERGINLSGGQKQRIQLARAVYQDCDIYLFDDIFSAVDAHTGSEIFKECLRGTLKDKTILLVTHQVDFLHNANQIMVMRDGMIVQCGKYQELLESGTDFRELVAAYETSMELIEVSTSIEDSNNSNLQTAVSPIAPLTRGNSHEVEKPKSEDGTCKLIEDEEREIGSVSIQVYREYSTQAFGWLGVWAVLIVSIMWQLLYTTCDYWLAYETSGRIIFKSALFISIYALLVGVTCSMVLVRSFLVAFLGLKTCQSFFSQIVDSIIHAPMSFFDTTPSGRILNRASTDQAALDFIIPYLMGTMMSMYFSVFGVLAIMCVNAWPTLILVIPLIWFNFYLRNYYLTTSRELSRLDGITKAPIIHHFSETLSGTMTIRCFRKQEFFFHESIRRLNANLRMDFHNAASNEWLGFRLEVIGTIFLCIATIFMVCLPATVVKPEYVGLTLSYGLTLNSLLFYTAYLSCMVENKMVSVERIKQFIRIPSEAPWRKTDCLPSPDWPTRGEIDITNVQVRYRSNTPLVLKGITLRIQGGEKIGIVGRTGSGKTTLIQVLFRLVEPSNGNIIIDGIDIGKLGLHDVRSRFGIIPQDPVLFEGTVRSNIDPLGLYSDEEIWKSLERCQLKDVVTSRPEKLEAPVVDGGDNFSVGQRQLLCLGRVMLKRCKILFMDEATASIDSQTDSIVQKIIREDFAECTIISIAHRITTVMDCDRVLVMDAGRVKEFDVPARLLERPSLFQALVQEYASRSDI